MIPSVVLAAGLSSRMGRTKAALPLPGGANFLTRILHALAEGGTTQIVVVTGRDANDVRDAGTYARVLVPVAYIGNPDTSRGQLSSLAVGLTALPKDIEGVVVTLSDIPLTTPKTVRALIRRWDETRAAVVRPTRDGRHGHPIVLDRTVLDAIHPSRLTQTMRELMEPFLPGDEMACPDDDGPFEDFDTLEEYQALMKRLRKKKR
jgi:CTP:molybdopterin cytidylyltransferase MocA